MPSSIPLDDTLGALYVGVMLSSLIYGINCMQFFLYYTAHSKRDTWVLKTFVTVLWVMETTTCFLMNYGLYYYTVTQFGDYHVLLDDHTVWSILVEISFSAFVALQVQCFFAHRVYILGGKRLALPIIIVLLSLAQFAFGIAYTDISLGFPRLTGGASDFPYVITLFGLELVADCMIAVSSVYYLRSHSSRSQISAGTNRVIEVLIKFVVNTCALEVFCIVPIIILWTTKPNSLIYSPFIMVLARIYSASILSSLNNRDHLREFTSQTLNGAIVMSDFQARSGALRGRRGNLSSLHTTRSVEPSDTILTSPIQIRTRTSRSEDVEVLRYEGKKEGLITVDIEGIHH